MRRALAYATLKLACWIGRIGFKLAGIDMRESVCAVQVVPTKEREERERREWLDKLFTGGEWTVMQWGVANSEAKVNTVAPKERN